MADPAEVKAKLRSAFRDFRVDGVPSSGANEPVKSEARAGLDALVDLAGQSTVTKAVKTVADLATIPSPAVGDSARVTADPLGNVTNGNGVWSWGGAGWAWVGPWVDPAVNEKLSDAVEVSNNIFNIFNAQNDEAFVVGKSSIPVSGINQSGTNTIVLTEPVTVNGIVGAVRLYAGAAGNLKLKVFTPEVAGVPIAQAGNLTLVREKTISIPGAGVHEISVSVPVAKGDFVGFYSGVLTIPHRVVSTTSPGWIQSAGDVSTMVGGAPVGGSTGVMQQFSVTVYGDRLGSIKQSLADSVIAEEVIGHQGALDASGTATITGSTRVFRKPVKSKGRLRKVRWSSPLGSAPLIIRIYAPSTGRGLYRVPNLGDQYTKVSDLILYPKVAGLNEAVVDVSVEAGDIIGMAGDGTYYRSTETGEEFIGATGVDLATLTVSQIATSNRLQVAFDLEVAGVEGAGAEVWAASDPAPSPVPPRTAIVTGSNIGLVYSDGTGWFKSGPRLPNLTCDNAIVVRASDRSILLGRRIDDPSEAYSTTKLMTALITERFIADWSSTVTLDVTEGLWQAGDVVTYSDLVHAALMPSDNEASRALGRFVGKVINPAAADNTAATAAFVAAMNTAASEIGMGDAEYRNVWGEATVSARSQAKLILYMADNSPKSINVAGKKTAYTVAVSGPNARNVTLAVPSWSQQPNLPEIAWGKTGTGNFRGNFASLCMVNGVAHAVIVLQSYPEGSRWANMRACLDHGRYSQNARDDLL